MKTLTYKGYEIELAYEGNLLRNKVSHLQTFICVESETLDGFKKEFEFAIDDYLKFCKEEGKEPEKPFKGVFQVRINPDLHRSLAKKAASKNIPLNTLINDALKKAV